MVRRLSTELSVLLGLLGAHLALVAYYAPRLPARVASHFGPSGAPDAWTTREGLLIGLGAVPLFLTLVFLAAVTLVRRTSGDSINLPHKAYWLAPERRAESLARIERSVLQIGIATQLLLLVVFAQVFRVNASGASHLGNFVWTALLAYSLVLVGLLWNMVRGFARPTVS